MYSFFVFSSRRRHTRYIGDWSSDVCSSDLLCQVAGLTCALELKLCLLKLLFDGAHLLDLFFFGLPLGFHRRGFFLQRSEERRVGKECRSVWSAVSSKTNTHYDVLIHCTGHV